MPAAQYINRLNEQNLSSLKLTPYIFLYKYSFRIPVNTWHTTGFQVYPSAVPACEVLYLRWILGHKIVRKFKFWDSKNPSKKFTKMVLMVNYIPRFNFVCKLQWFQGFWRWKKQQQQRSKSFGIKFGWNFQRFPYY